MSRDKNCPSFRFYKITWPIYRDTWLRAVLSLFFFFFLTHTYIHIVYSNIIIGFRHISLVRSGFDMHIILLNPCSGILYYLVNLHGYPGFNKLLLFIYIYIYIWTCFCFSLSIPLAEGDLQSAQNAWYLIKYTFLIPAWVYCIAVDLLKYMQSSEGISYSSISLEENKRSISFFYPERILFFYEEEIWAMNLVEREMDARGLAKN
jgi:hypothetical protein